MRIRASRLGLRTRLMVVGVTGVAVALVVGGVLLYGALGLAIQRTVDAEALAGAKQVAALVDQGEQPDPIPVSGSQIAQVVDARNRVLTASLSSDRLTALLRPGEVVRARAGERLTVPGSRVGLTGPLRVVAVPAGPSSDPVTVVVGQQTGDVAHSQNLLRTGLLVAFPLLLAVLGLIAWHVIGWTLRPVEALRQDAERISGSGHAERLPVPEAADEIRALAATLNDMLGRLAAARNRQRSFVADAAHELRSPLASMRTQLEVAQRLGDTSELTEDLLTDVNRLAGLAEDLLLLARSDADLSTSPAREQFPVVPLLAEVAERHAGRRVPVTAAPDPASRPVTVSVHREELRRVLNNLVDNAVRHAKTQVHLEATAAGAWSVLTVIDDGPGIPEEDRGRVFDRFTRLDDVRDRDTGGAGLGLAIVRELVQRVEGTVTLEDASQAAEPGLRVEVRLPR